MFLLGGFGIAVEIQKLRSIQADSFAALSIDKLGLIGKFYITQHHHALAIPSNGRLFPYGIQAVL